MKCRCAAFAAFVLIAASCSAGTGVSTPQILAVDDEINSVEIDDGRVRIELDESAGGGSLVLGGGEVPKNLPIPIPGGGRVISSIAQGDSYAVALEYPPDRYEELREFYEDWVTARAVENVIATRSTDPRSDGWSGTIEDSSFVVTLLESPDDAGSPAASAVLTWEG